MVLDENQITRIIEQLLKICVNLHRKNITIGNLHANNVFIDENYPDDVLVTDVGFAYVPNMGPSTDVQAKFEAPEIQGKTTADFEMAVREAPGQADIYSIGRIAKFLLVGNPDYSADDL